MADVTTASLITQIRALIQDLQKTDGNDVFAYDSDSTFKLSEDWVNSTGMKVYQNGTEMNTSDWSYNSDTNRVTIAPVTSGVSLVKNDTIIITYDYYEKYSDSEITSYIQASLVYFVKHRYFKEFSMNSSNEVVTINGVNPSTREGNIIALITAITITPNNIDIRTPDFTISASENKSKTEQIDYVFEIYMRDFGTVDFLDIED